MPRLAGTGDLTARTLSVVRADEEPKALLPASLVERFPKELFRKGAIVTAWAAALALAAVTGFAVTNRPDPDPSDELLRRIARD